MNRREVLGVAGAVAIAGCTSSETDDSQPDDDQDGTESSPAQTQADDERDEKPAPTPEASVTDADLVNRVTAGDYTEAAVTGTVENTGDVRLGLVSVAAKFYNADGELLSSSPWNIRDFEVGEVWEPWVPYGGDHGRVDHAELVITDTTGYNRTVSPDGIVTESTDVQVPVDDYAMPRVTGKVVNQSGRAADYLEVRPKLYAENGNLLETRATSIQQLGTGQSWRFDVQVSFKNESWKDRIDSHSVVVTE